MCNQLSTSLVECLKTGDKLELAEVTSQLMPEGKPDFKLIRHMTPIKTLCETVEGGRKTIRAYVFFMVKSLCDSLNVVRNMNEDQMIEAAAFLIDECGDMRLEDYQMMFTLAKRGQLVKIMDRVDIDVIGKIYDAYWAQRNDFAKRMYEKEYLDYENSLKVKNTTPETPEEIEMSERFGKLVGTMKAWEDEVEDEKEKEQKELAEKRKAGYKNLENLDIDKIRENFAGLTLENKKQFPTNTPQLIRRFK